MLKFLRICAAHIVISMCFAQYDPPLYMHRHTVVNAEERGALCNDGTPAAFYYRGCNETYYKNDQGGCVDITQNWIIAFQSGGEYCFDKASCQDRRKRQPDLLTAATVAKQVVPGLEQPYPESNPNFYKAHAVWVPYCSSDLWLGNSSGSTAVGMAGPGFDGGFRGRAILKAVLEDLMSVRDSGTGADDDGEPEGAFRFPLRSAERVLITGGPGVALQAREVLGATLPTNISAAAKMLCDGCVVLDRAPLVPVSQSHPCTTSMDCPPLTALQAGWSLWAASAPSTCRYAGAASAFKCLLAPSLLAPGAGGIMGSMQTLVQHPLYDSTQLSMLRAWPPNANDTARVSFISAFGEAVRAVLKSRRFAFGAGCESPYVYSQTHTEYYDVKVNGLPFAASMSAAVPQFLNDPDTFQQDRYVDTCAGVACNPSGCGSKNGQ